MGYRADVTSCGGCLLPPRQASLTHLLIGGNNIRDEGCTAVAEAMQQSESCKIEELDLSRNDIGAQGAKSLAAMMAVKASLTQVLGCFASHLLILAHCYCPCAD